MAPSKSKKKQHGGITPAQYQELMGSPQPAHLGSQSIAPGMPGANPMIPQGGMSFDQSSD